MSLAARMLLPRLLPPLLRRLLRMRLFKVLRHGQYTVTVVRKRILIYCGGKLRHRLKVERGSRPLRSGVTAAAGHLFYGDYWGNPQREPARLYRVELATGRRETLYSFDWVRHIHFVQQDRRRPGALLVGTGDLDRESGIYRFFPDSRRLETIGAGSQTWRAVSILQEEEVLIWGTDDPDGRNFICRFNEETGELSRLRDLPGPAYYTARDARGRLYLATAVEDRRRHRAVIYRSVDKGESWAELRELRKDRLPDRLFGHGVVEFCDDQEEREEPCYILTGGLKELR